MAKLYLLFGYPGAGKTTVAQIVHDLTGAVHLSSDKVRMQLFAKPTFTDHEHAELYNALDRQTTDLLEAGHDVIYDANLNRFKHRQDKYAISARTGAQPILLWIQTPKALAKTRAADTSRQHLWPEKETPAVMFDRIAHVIEEPRADEPYIAIDGTTVTPESIKQALSL